MYDVVIVGAGIIGSFLAYDLSKYDLRILVIDKENDVANKTTMANSAIVHTGYDPEDGTLKALLNIKGARMYEEICNKLNVPYEQIGAYVVGKTEEDRETLAELKRRAIQRGVVVEELTREMIIENEPNLSDELKYGLSFPETAIIDPMLTAITLMDVAVNNGVELALNNEVKEINKTDVYRIVTDKGEYETKVVVNAAGLNSDKIAAMVDDNSYKVNFYKGEYFVLDRVVGDYVKHIIYPTPTKAGKGVLAVPTVHGNIMLGPTSTYTEDEDDVNTDREGLDMIQEKLKLIVKNPPYRNIIRSFAGLRSKVAGGDFIIEESRKNKNFFNLIGIDSPGVASAPAISEYVIENLLSDVLDLKEKDDYEENAPDYVKVMELELDERNKLINVNPNYGKIICRCEKISEQEIVNAIHRPVMAKTVKAIKKRCRPGMGKCQGGFCQPLITTILERELGVGPTEVNYDADDSNVLDSLKGDSYE